MSLVYIFVLVLIAAGLLWHWADPSLFRTSIFGLFAMLSGVAALDSLGAPKPIQVEFRDVGIVVAAEYKPNEAIYIWTRGDPPIAYKLPWKEEDAKKLESGLREAKEKGEDGIAFASTRYGEYVFHPIPIKETPYKEPPG